ncbi:hypothetical protein JTB14_015884 [Gonioctena quinquepunctata]|nr:hypothetical protein JTB14_015884 [Gonioctena quinquepunctata]
MANIKKNLLEKILELFEMRRQSNVISAPPKTPLTTAKTLLHGIIQLFVYLSVPLATLYYTPYMRKKKGQGHPSDSS